MEEIKTQSTKYTTVTSFRSSKKDQPGKSRAAVELQAKAGKGGGNNGSDEEVAKREMVAGVVGWRNKYGAAAPTGGGFLGTGGIPRRPTVFSSDVASL